MSASARTRTALVFIAAIALAALIRLRGLGDLVAHGDEQFYLLVGQHMLHDGAIPYVDIWDRKPAGLFALYAVIAALPGEDIVGYQIVATLAAGATAALIYLWVSRFVGLIGAGLAALLYLVLLQAHLGFGGQAEVFVNSFVTLAGFMLLPLWEDKLVRPRWRAPAVAMLLVGIAIQLKPTAVFPGAWLGLVICWATWRHRLPLPQQGSVVIAAALAAALPTAVVVLVYLASGHFDDFFYANILSIVNKSRVETGAETARLVQLSLRLGSVFGVAIALLAWSAWRGQWDGAMRRTVLVVGGWFLAGVVAFLSLPAAYPHYAMILMPMGCLLVGLAARPGVPRIIMGVAAIALSARLLAADVARIERNRQDSPRIAALARTIAGRLHGDCLYVYRGPLVLYSLTGSCLPTRWAFPNHLSTMEEAGALGVDPAAEVRRILATRPGVIVVSPPSFHIANAATGAIVSRHLAAHYRPLANLRDTTGAASVIAYERR